MDDNINMRNKQERIVMKKFAPTKEFWLLLLSFLLGMLCFGGCASQPVAKYCITTSCPDVWAEQPVQNVSFRMEFTK
jgi:hypothetical protein